MQYLVRVLVILLVPSFLFGCGTSFFKESLRDSEEKPSAKAEPVKKTEAKPEQKTGGYPSYEKPKAEAPKVSETSKPAEVKPVPAVSDDIAKLRKDLEAKEAQVAILQKQNEIVINRFQDFAKQQDEKFAAKTKELEKRLADLEAKLLATELLAKASTAANLRQGAIFDEFLQEQARKDKRLAEVESQMATAIKASDAAWDAVKQQREEKPATVSKPAPPSEPTSSFLGENWPLLLLLIMVAAIVVIAAIGLARRKNRKSSVAEAKEEMEPGATPPEGGTAPVAEDIPF